MSYISPIGEYLDLVPILLQPFGPVQDRGTTVGPSHFMETGPFADRPRASRCILGADYTAWHPGVCPTLRQTARVVPADRCSIFISHGYYRSGFRRELRDSGFFRGTHSHFLGSVGMQTTCRVCGSRSVDGLGFVKSNSSRPHAQMSRLFHLCAWPKAPWACLEIHCR